MEEQETITTRVTASRPFRGFMAWLAVVGGIIVVGIAWWALWQARQSLALSFLGTWIFWCVFAILTAWTLAAILYPLIWVLRSATRVTTFVVEAQGIGIQNLLGRLQIIPPQAPTTSHIAQSKKGKMVITPVVPSILQMLGNDIREDQTDMLVGYEQAKTQLTPYRDPFPGTAIIAGNSGAGKTRRTIMLVFQVLIARAVVDICDPHGDVGESLLKTMTPLLPWVRTAAIAEQDIVCTARAYLAEMNKRLHDDSNEKIDGQWIPRLIVFEEWPSLMKSEQLSKDDKKVLMQAVRESGTQFRKVQGFAWIVGQEFTEDGIGDTAIRKGAHAIFCHQLSEEYAKFLFTSFRKAQRLVGQIERRECIYKDRDNHIHRVVTPKISDADIPELADYLADILPQVQRVIDSAPYVREQIAQHSVLAPREASQSGNNIIYMPEARQEVNGSTTNNAEARQEVNGSTFKGDNELAKEVQIGFLREVGKRLKAGEDPNDIRRSLEIKGGRALQEVNAALELLAGEDIG